MEILTPPFQDVPFYDLPDKSTDELIQLLARATNDIAQIKMQMSRAHERRQVTGEFSDPEWYRKAERALSYKGVYLQRINLALRAARAKEHKSREVEQKLRDSTWERAFVKAARAALDPETFAAIVSEANTMVRLGV